VQPVTDKMLTKPTDNQSMLCALFMGSPPVLLAFRLIHHTGCGIKRLTAS
jgi:hypothetical protein